MENCVNEVECLDLPRRYPDPSRPRRLICQIIKKKGGLRGAIRMYHVGCNLRRLLLLYIDNCYLLLILNDYD